MNGVTGTTATDGEVMFEVGDVVVHPHHGAGVVVGRRRRRLLGSAPRGYLEMEFGEDALRIMVPCDAVGAVGLRSVAGDSLIGRIADVLGSQPESVSGSWSARLRHYQRMLKAGDVLALAAVVRDLAQRESQSGLLAGERDLYQRSREMLASELRYALDVDHDRALAYIDERIVRPPRPVG